MAKTYSRINQVASTRGRPGRYPVSRATIWRCKIDLHDYADGLAADTSLTDEQCRAVLMDELLAHMAEKKTVLRQKINESIGAVRAWLREHGFAQLAGYGSANLARLLANVRKSLAAKPPARPRCRCLGATTKTSWAGPKSASSTCCLPARQPETTGPAG